MPDATFACPDLTTFAGLDELGLEVVGQRLEPDCAVLACRVLAPDGWCRRCGCEGAARDALAAAAATPLISLHETTGQHRPVGLEALPNHHQAELVEAGERGRSYGLSSEAAAVFELAV